MYKLPSGGALSTLAKELTAGTHIMQRSLNDLSTLVSGKARCKTNEGYFMMPSYSRADVGQLLVGGCPRGVMVKAMNCGIVVREFVLQSRYYVHFRANTLGKGMNPLILPPAMDK